MIGKLSALKEKSFRLFLVLVLAVSFSPSFAYAATTTQPSFVYTIDGDRAVISGLTRELAKNENLVIPEKIDNCPVTSVSNIRGNGGTITLPSSLEEVGGISGFSGDFVIPGNVSKITSDIEAGTFDTVTIQEGNLKEITDKGKITLFPWLDDQGDGVKDVYLPSSLEYAEMDAWGTRNDLVHAVFHLPSTSDNQKRLRDVGIIYDAFDHLWPAHIYKYDYIDAENAVPENICIDQFADCYQSYSSEDREYKYSSFKGTKGDIEAYVLPLSTDQSSLTISSSNTKVAVVDQNRGIKTVSPGKCSIIAEASAPAGNIEKSFDLTVYGITESKTSNKVSASSLLDLFNLNPYLGELGNMSAASLELIASEFTSDKERIEQIKNDLYASLHYSFVVDSAYEIRTQIRSGVTEIHVQPSNGKVNLSIELPDGFNENNELIHLKNRGEIEKIDYKVVTERGIKKAVFSTSSFSQFVFINRDATVQGKWIKDKKGWWYKHGNGSYTKNNWEKINGKWYFFNNAGYMSTGWKSDKGSWYYLSSTGAMKTGWQKVKGKWYLFDSAGKMLAGKQIVSGKTYFLKSDGAMRTGWVQQGSDWYYCLSFGAAKTNGWQKVKNTWYHFASDGKMQTGWLDLKGTKYYLEKSGAMKTGWKQLDKQWYYFAGSGAMKTGWAKVKGTWYYLRSDGIMQTGKHKIGNATYYLKSNGAMKTGWNQENKQWFYYSGSGAMQVNKWIGGKYWVGTDGVMATNSWVDNDSYYVNAKGEWVPNRKKAA